MFRLFLFLWCIALATSCGSGDKDKKNLFSIEVRNAKKGHKVDELLQLTVSGKTMVVDSFALALDGQVKGRFKGSEDIQLNVSGEKLGKRRLTAQVYSGGSTYSASKDITLLAAATPKLYSYTVVETYPHDPKAWTQGLEFENDTLYESTGRYERSSLRKTDLESGSVLKNVPLPDQYFGEGLTILNNRIYQLTWKQNTGFIYRLDKLEKTGTFVYGESKEGWGLCNDGKTIYKSDGTERIWSLNSETLSEDGYIELYTNTAKIPRVNELEWVDGKIYANIWQKDAIAIVDPESGAVEGVIDLSSLKSRVTQHDELDVLNGIAYRGEEGILYVTGKNWDKLFKIRIEEK